MSTAAGAPRVLVVGNTLCFPPYLDEPVTGDGPRAWLTDVDADVQYLDQRLLTQPPRWLLPVYRRLPMWVVQVLEVHRVGARYDVVFLWSVAHVTLVLAVLLRLTGRRLPLVALLTRVSEPKKARLLRLGHRAIARIILPPVTQREFATERLGVPADTFADLPWTVDSVFWRSERPASDGVTICAAGGEMRDYATLVEAMAGLDIPCHIAGALDTSRRDWWNERGDSPTAQLPANVTVGTLSAPELRALYERSRLVVVPLQPTTSDNGITCMNEAWSMGRPVVVSAVEGQRDAFVDGREGVWVPQGDAAALRETILALWNDPERCDAMGAAGRVLVERDKDHDVFSAGLNELVAEVAAAGRRRETARR